MKYIIYGAGGNGRIVTALLFNSRCSILAIIDKRAAELDEINEIPILALQELNKISGDKDNTIVIITVKNVFEHTSIAREMHENGFSNLIYKPLPLLQGYAGEHWDSIGEAYESLTSDMRFPLGKQVRKTVLENMICFQDSLTIKQEGGKRKVWMPVELICNYDNEEAWGKIGMIVFFPLVEFYKCLLSDYQNMGWNECKDNYLLYCGEWLDKNNLDMTESQQKSFLNSRVNISYEMQKKYDYSHNFFIQNAPEVTKGSDNKFFISTSGRNRVAFQIAKGCNYIPVVMSEKNFREWENKKQFERFRLQLQKLKKDKLFTNVQSPLLTEYPIIAADYNRLVCSRIANYIMKEVYLSARVINKTYQTIKMNKITKCLSEFPLGVWTKDEGSLSRYLQRLQIHHTRIWNLENEEDRMWTQEIDKLLDFNAFEENSTLGVEWKTMNYLVMDNRVTDGIPNQFGGEIVFLIYWENLTDILEFIDSSDYVVLQELSFAIWEEKEIKLYLLIRKGCVEK